MKSYLRRTKYAIFNFKEDITDNLAVIIPALVVMTMLITWIVAFVMFILSAEYSSQIEILKLRGFGFDGVSEAFTNGTVHILYGKIVGTIVNTLLGAQTVIFLLSFFRESTKVQRIIMMIDLLVAGFFTIGTSLLFFINTRKIELSEKQILSISSILDSSNLQSIKIVSIVVAVVVMATVISLLILVLKSNSKWILGYGCLAALLVYIVLPLVLLLIENIIPLIAGIVILSIIGVAIWFFFTFVVGEGHSSSPKSSSDSENWETESKKIDKKCEYVDRGFLGIKLYRVHGILHDYVERDNGIGTGEVCSLHDLRKGNFHIYDKATGKMIAEHEIPWRN